MNSIRKLWFDRAGWFWTDAIKYLKIILIGYAYLPLILLISIAYLYHYMLKAVPPGWDFGWILAPLITLAVTRSPVRTFIKKPDPLFLFPMEHRLTDYFRLSLLYSALVQGFALFFIFLVLSPLYYAKISPSSGDFYQTFVLLLGVKWGNIWASWNEYRLPQNAQALHVVGRSGLNFLICLYLFHIPLIPGSLLLGLGVVWVLYYYAGIWKRTRLSWPNLVQGEEESLARFYTFAQWFMDVPNYTVRMKKRTLWVEFIQRIPLLPKKGHFYLYSRSLLRYRDVSSHYFRLTVFGGVCLYVMPSSWLWATAVFLFSLASNAIQIMNTWSRLKFSFWDRIHPFPADSRKKGFQRVLFLFLFLQSALMSVVLAKNGILWLSSYLLFGFIVSYVVSYPIMGRKIDKTLNT
ncbi:ABC transporter permease [Ammoniphilus sp. YIM 78166]|uniref:ABC transporter permease n=1 Tax=Ammoniphilus sp. YIM 78166 TaxID=1644106 RepID=UPI00106FAAE9|nr:ABC transporter permease [Ammoniphilus sp. YIM 78166]